MKRLFALLFLPLLLVGAPAEVVNLYSGKPQELPGEGAWSLAAAHGRILATGQAENGRISLNLPVLEPGSTLEATLTFGGGPERKLRFHSLQPLRGCSALPLHPDDARLAEQLKALGLGEGDGEKLPVIGSRFEANPGRLTIVFSTKSDFPLPLPAAWKSLTLHHAKIPGRLSVYASKKENLADADGDGSCLEIRLDAKTRLLLLTPGFDLGEIENVLLLKQILKEKQP